MKNQEEASLETKIFMIEQFVREARQEEWGSRKYC